MVVTISTTPREPVLPGVLARLLSAFAALTEAASRSPDHVSLTNVPTPREPRHSDERWQTICYALDSNARTLRLCLIRAVAIVSPVAATVITMLIRHMLLCQFRPELAPGPVPAAYS